MKVLVLFYSTYGHTYRMAEAVAEGSRSVKGAEVDIRRVPETLSEDILANMGAVEAQKAFAHIPTAKVEDLEKYHAIIFGTPTRYGNMCGQMRQFLDATGPLWAKDALVGKVGSVFTSSGTEHGGQESTILTFHVTLLHLGMIIVGLPYSFKGQTIVDKVIGCSPYGSSTIAGPAGARMPNDVELEGARYQGRFAAETASKLFS
jgi:NAD(P)H dehydrogenase (quinone)